MQPAVALSLEPLSLEPLSLEPLSLEPLSLEPSALRLEPPAMLDRVAVHQTRLGVPGVGLDARGVVLGARGLVLLPSLDRLVAFLAVYTEEQGLAPLLESLRIEVVRSKLGARELVLSFEAGSSDRLDRIAEVSRLAGGYLFTGTSRHYVQYRDAAAPFGYDANDISAGNSDLVLYHTQFTQAYDSEREIALSDFMRRLQPLADPAFKPGPGEYWLLAEAGVGPALGAHLRRSSVEARAGIAEWPPESSLDDAPVTRWLLHVPELPARLVGLACGTPGITAFRPEATGAAVEVGFRHPVTLRSCPVFPKEGLVLFRGGNQDPLVLERLPRLGDLRSLARATLSPEAPAPGKPRKKPPRVSLSLELGSEQSAPRAVEASLVKPEEFELLRHLAYYLPPSALAETRIALTTLGAFLLCQGGIDVLPLGHFFRRVHPRVFLPLGLDLVPRVSPTTLYEALGAPSEQLLFYLPDGKLVGLDESRFDALEVAITSGSAWAPLDPRDLEPLLATELPELEYEPLGLRPLSRAREP